MLNPLQRTPASPPQFTGLPMEVGMFYDVQSESIGVGHWWFRLTEATNGEILIFQGGLKTNWVGDG